MQSGGVKPGFWAQYSKHLQDGVKKSGGAKQVLLGAIQ
jgi:hypothetical protein